MTPPLKISSAIVSAIIEAQAKIVGPLAWEQATLVYGIKLDPIKKYVAVVGDPKRVIKELVLHYEQLFGRGALEVCREAVQPFINDETKDILPSILR
ncbi:MAG: hypothetical protein U0517_02435 [Candidatus Andersenbacteria bacterium]